MPKTDTFLTTQDLFIFILTQNKRLNKLFQLFEWKIATGSTFEWY